MGSIARTITGMCLILAVFTSQGCGAKKPAAAQGQWQEKGIFVDGSIKEWPERPPQFHDKERRVAVRVMNDDASVSIAVSIGSESLKQQVLISGLGLVLAPEGADGKPFEIRVDGKRPHRMSEPLDLRVTYPHSSGPMRMTQAEAKGYGIDLAMSGPDRPRMVIEAKISWDAFLTEPFEPGRAMTVSFRTLAPRLSRLSLEGGKAGKSGNRPMKGGKGKKMQPGDAMKPYEAKVKIIFAGGAVG